MYQTQKLSSLAVCLLVAGGLACGASNGSADPFAPGVKKIVLEVDYMAGAEPYTGSIGKGHDTWELFETNMKALFEKTGAAVEVPKALDEMEELPASEERGYDTARILEIANEHRDLSSTGDSVAYYAVWLDGWFVKDGEENHKVLGVTLEGTPIIAIFKPAIERIPGDLFIHRFIEQTVLIHEFGHVIGLVNSGLPMQSPHEDPDHPNHCTNDQCIMYWANEGAADLANFIKKLSVTGNTVVFGKECLADAYARASENQK